MTNEMKIRRERVEALGFEIRYSEYMGTPGNVRIVNKETGELICTHFNAQGAIDAFFRRRHAGN